MKLVCVWSHKSNKALSSFPICVHVLSKNGCENLDLCPHCPSKLLPCPVLPVSISMVCFFLVIDEVLVLQEDGYLHEMKNG